MSTDHAQQHPVDLYDSTYGRFDETLYADIRRRVWGEEIGQNGWITAAEQDQLIRWMKLDQSAAQKRVLDVACGSGGPTLRIAERTGASVVGVDINTAGIAAAERAAAERGMPAERASFRVVDGGAPLPFGDAEFDAVLCVDAINHLPDRERVLKDWARVVRPGGRVVFVDPIVLTGAISNEEIAVRSSIGFFLFVAPGVNERAIDHAGLRLVETVDLTEAVATIAAAWAKARLERAEQLRRLEGDATFEGQQRFLDVAARLAAERRLSRFAYAAVRA